MATIKSSYLGHLRTEAIHINSNNKIITDAPLDNNGKGEAFSPTDLVCAALGSCMMTIMGIVASRDNIDLTSVNYSTTKMMEASPRRISEIQIDFDMRNVKATPEQYKKLENAAHTCPVALSLDPKIVQKIKFIYEG